MSNVSARPAGREPAFSLPKPLAVDVCGRLGTTLPTSLADVDELYRRWCAEVPFDPVLKAIAMDDGELPPGTDPAGFCEHWLTTGVGGLCWPMVTGLAALLDAADIRCTIALDRMLIDHKIDFHAFVVVHDGDRLLAADPVHLSNALLPMEPGARGSHAQFGTGFDECDGRLHHWFTHPEAPEKRVEYVVLSTVLDAADVRAFCELSAFHSGVGAGRFWARRSPASGFLHVRADDDGHELVVKRWLADGLVESAATPADGLRELGYTDDGIALVERAGMLVTEPVPRFVRR